MYAEVFLGNVHLSRSEGSRAAHEEKVNHDAVVIGELLLPGQALELGWPSMIWGM